MSFHGITGAKVEDKELKKIRRISTNTSMNNLFPRKPLHSVTYRRLNSCV